jgi:hypothetical protein
MRHMRQGVMSASVLYSSLEPKISYTYVQDEYNVYLHLVTVTKMVKSPRRVSRRAVVPLPRSVDCCETTMEVEPWGPY